MLLGPETGARLPQHILRAIKENERSSEIVVCIVQFLAIMVFGLVYAFSPKAFPPYVPFEPVPLALGAYTLFTGLRLALVLRNKLTPAFVAASVVIDIALLMLTIWSFHLQYQQPATVYLKAPTLFYVFILISLRTMRLEPAYVLLTGLSAVIGWSVLVSYALATEGMESITRDFPTYMTSHSVLIGAEVDKVLSIAVVTAILSISVIRARRLMIVGATEAHASRQLARFFAPQVAGEIRQASDTLLPGHAVLRKAAIMMIDMRGFTKLSAQLAPAETVALLRSYHQCIVPEIERHNGGIDKYLGDGIIATFGAVEGNEGFACDALRGMEGLLEAARQWKERSEQSGLVVPDIGVGVTVGKVLFGVTGTEGRPEFTVIGDPVNLAVKLEKHCKTLGVRGIVSAATMDLACRQGFVPRQCYNQHRGETIDGVDSTIDLLAVP
jgi:adenylate cyclase